MTGLSESVVGGAMLTLHFPMKGLNSSKWNVREDPDQDGGYFAYRQVQQVDETSGHASNLENRGRERRT